MTEPTAEEAFTKAYDEIYALTVEIQDKASHRWLQSFDSPDWGDVGDLNAIAEALREIAEGK